MKIFSPFGLLALVAGFLLSYLAAHAQTEIPLRKIKAANNTVSDAEYGVSMSYPTGWKLERGFRWGASNEKTTIVLRQTQPAFPLVNLFYQKFSADSPRPREIKDWFHSSFREKQAAKKNELKNYQNEPESLAYGTTAGGLPKCSYTATFTKGSRRLVEYYVRVAGATTYVMFLTEGTREEIESMRPDIDQMADTLRLP